MASRIHSACFPVLAMWLLASTGCSSATGFTLWPNQFPLLPQAKDFASRAALPTSLPIENCKTVLPAYFVEPGDSLLIEPIDFAADLRLPADQRVLLDGTIDLGEFGRVVVAGMTVEQIEEVVETRVATVLNRRHPVNVRLLEPNGARYYVLGEVGSPAAYPLVGRETVLDAIVTAGGLTSRAAPCDIILVRPTGPCECRVVLPVCYRELTQLGDTTTNYQLQPGDRIVVGSRSFCDELRFWRSNRGCERCLMTNCTERDPRRANYLNPFCHIPAGPALPWYRRDAAADGTGEEVPPLNLQTGSPAPTARIDSSRHAVATEIQSPVHFSLQ
jgi:polysaccharide biosynthesis/export protein